MLAMNHIHPKDHRDMQPRLLHRYVLIVVRFLRPNDVEHRADRAPLRQLVITQLRPLRPRRKSRRILHRLPNLFLQRHLLQQRIDFGVQLPIGQLRIRHRYRR